MLLNRNTFGHKGRKHFSHTQFHTGGNAEGLKHQVEFFVFFFLNTLSMLHGRGQKVIVFINSLPVVYLKSIQIFVLKMFLNCIPTLDKTIGHLSAVAYWCTF